MILFLISCNKTESQSNVSEKIKNTSKKTDSLRILEELIETETKLIPIKPILNKYENVKFPFDTSISQTRETYMKLFQHLESNKEMPYFISQQDYGDINKDGIPDLLFSTGFDMEEKEYRDYIKYCTIRDSILSTVSKNEYFLKNNKENYIKLFNKFNVTFPIPIIVLLGQKDNKYILKVDNAKIIPLSSVGDRQIRPYNFELQITKTGSISMNIRYFDIRFKDLQTEFQPTFIYNLKEQGWILEKANIHFWSDIDPDINDYYELTPKDFGKMTLKTFDFNNVYKMKTE